MEREKEYYIELFKEWKKELTSEEKKVLCKYSDNFHREINPHLLNPDECFFIPEYERQIELLDSALNYELKENINVFRAEYRTDNIDKIIMAYSILDEIIEIYPNYISTSFTKRGAITHMGVLRNSEMLAESFIIANLEVKKGVKCGYLDSELSAMKESENEILISRRSVQAIKKYQKMQGFDDVVEIFGDISII